jgi:hypothetical protein
VVLVGKDVSVLRRLNTSNGSQSLRCRLGTSSLIWIFFPTLLVLLHALL